MINIKEDRSPGWSLEEKFYMPDMQGRRGIDVLNQCGLQFVYGNTPAEYGICKNGDPAQGVPRNKSILVLFEPPSQIGYIYDPAFRAQWLKVFSMVADVDPAIPHSLIPRSFNIVPKYFNEPRSKFLMMIGRDMNSISQFQRQDLTKVRRDLARYMEEKLGPEKFDLYGRWDKDLAPKCYRGELGPVAHGLVGYNLSCPATDLNGQGKTWDYKYELLSKHEFALALENSMWPGYLGCKCLEAQCCGTIPIYIGATDVDRYMPSDVYIDMRGRSFDDILRIITTMTEDEKQAYRARIYKWLEGQGSEIFSSYNFARKFVRFLGIDPDAKR